MNELVVKNVRGRAVPVRGNDIDTDRIIPARFLKSVVFDGLGAHAFADDRAQLKAKGQLHPFDKPEHQGSKVLIVNANFGCGSSREHAPQAIMRWGIKVIVGVSFAEIFFGNNISLGVPCLKVSAADAEALQDAVEANPAAEVEVDLETLTVTVGVLKVKAELAEGPRQQFLAGSWDVTAELLANRPQIAVTAARLPYFSAWKA